MESALQGAVRAKHVRAGEIDVAPVAKLRDPNHESEMARFHKSGASSANMTCNRIMFSILDYHEDGGTTATAKGTVLDIKRMETRGEEFVYDTDGRIVHLDDGLPLSRLDDFFGARASRTMNRFFEKADKPSKRCVDHRLLSMMFWIDAARKIMDVR